MNERTPRLVDVSKDMQAWGVGHTAQMAEESWTTCTRMADCEVKDAAWGAVSHQDIYFWDIGYDGLSFPGPVIERPVSKIWLPGRPVNTPFLPTFLGSESIGFILEVYDPCSFVMIVGEDIADFRGVLYTLSVKPPFMIWNFIPRVVEW